MNNLKPLRILISGCGFLGQALGIRFAAEGHRVWGLRRDPSTLPPGIEPLAGDLRGLQRSDLPAAGFDFVYYLLSSRREDRDGYLFAHHGGVVRMLQLLGELPAPRRFFLASSTRVYGDRAGAWVSEETPTTPWDWTSEALLCGEEALLESSIPGTVVRFSGIYGPGRDRLLVQVARGEAAYDVSRAEYTNRIHVEDAAEALYLLAERTLDEEIADLYLVTDNEPVDRGVLLEWLTARLAAPQPRWYRSGETAPAGKRCSNLLIRKAGFHPTYPTWREGYGSMLRKVDPALLRGRG
ncbi:MAG: SDR family oxidoreductase [Acidobacteriota bacterium]